MHRRMHPPTHQDIHSMVLQAHSGIKTMITASQCCLRSRTGASSLALPVPVPHAHLPPIVHQRRARGTAVLVSGLPANTVRYDSSIPDFRHHRHGIQTKQLPLRVLRCWKILDRHPAQRWLQKLPKRPVQQCWHGAVQSMPRWLCCTARSLQEVRNWTIFGRCQALCSMPGRQAHPDARQQSSPQ